MGGKAADGAERHASHATLPSAADQPPSAAEPAQQQVQLRHGDTVVPLDSQPQPAGEQGSGPPAAAEQQGSERLAGEHPPGYWQTAAALDRFLEAYSPTTRAMTREWLALEPAASFERDWREYLCPGRHHEFDALKRGLLDAPLVAWAVGHLHPAVVFGCSPSLLPAGLLAPGSHLVLPPSALEVITAAAAAAAAAVYQALLQELQASEAADSGGSSGSGSGALPSYCSTVGLASECWCSECCPPGPPSDSPDERVAPGKRIRWRGTIGAADPVRRALFGDAAAAQPAAQAAPPAVAAPAQRVAAALPAQPVHLHASAAAAPKPASVQGPAARTRSRARR